MNQDDNEERAQFYVQCEDTAQPRGVVGLFMGVSSVPGMEGSGLPCQCFIAYVYKQLGLLPENIRKLKDVKEMNERFSLMRVPQTPCNEMYERYYEELEDFQ